MDAEEKGPEDQAPRPEEGGAAQGGLGLLFIAAGVALATTLGVVGLIAYWAMSR